MVTWANDIPTDDISAEMPRQTNASDKGALKHCDSLSQNISRMDNAILADATKDLTTKCRQNVSMGFLLTNRHLLTMMKMVFVIFIQDMT